MTGRRARIGPAWAAAWLVLLCACGTPPATPTAPGATDATQAPSASASATPQEISAIEPAQGSASSVFAPNPGAIVVAVEAGHGGCLDWGVADPDQRGEEFAEKAITLAIAHRLREVLQAEGIGVVMVRETDAALAGDLYPPLGCSGAPFRDVNGDGLAGFGPEVPEGTRARDEMQARLDVANVARGDVLVSIHVDSIADEGGNLLPIARTETFYTDETPWGPTAGTRLAEGLQAGVVAALGAAAGYERQDRGTRAHNLYMVAPPLFEPTEERPDPLRQPTRGALMPAALVEVGSITLPEERALLLDPAGQGAAAQGLLDGLTTYFGSRGLAARIDPTDGGDVPIVATEGDGPPYWIRTLGPADGSVTLPVRIMNTGTEAWPASHRLLAGWEASDAPYLRAPPEGLDPIGPALPALASGESVVVTLNIEPPDAAERQLLWLTLSNGDGAFSELGSPPLQLAVDAP
jgi:N-acetylmuramoyl-L-alanine amidase